MPDWKIALRHVMGPFLEGYGGSVTAAELAVDLIHPVLGQGEDDRIQERQR